MCWLSTILDCLTFIKLGIALSHVLLLMGASLFPILLKVYFFYWYPKDHFTRAANLKHHIPLHVIVSLSKVTAHDAISIPYISLETRLLEDMTAPQHHMLVDITLQPCFVTPVDSNERIVCQIV